MTIPVAVATTLKGYNADRKPFHYTYFGPKYESFESHWEKDYTPVYGPWYEGRVLSVEPCTIQIMSDVWETGRRCIYMDDDGSFKTTEYVTGYGSDYAGQVFQVDATDEVKAAYAKYLEEQRKIYLQREEEARKAREEQELKTPRIGKKVKVVRGNKVKIGTEGVLIWTGPNRFDRYNSRVGIGLGKQVPVPGKKYGRYETVVWTYLNNLEVVL